MKTLVALGSFKKINPLENYVIFIEGYERYGGGEVEHFIGTGQEVIEKLKEDREYEEWLVDYENDFKSPLSHLSEEKKLNKFLKWCDQINGDGYDYFQIFLISKTEN